MTRDPREGRRRQRSRQPRSRSRLLRIRKKRVTCKEKVLHCECGTYPCALFGNLEDAQLKSWHALVEHKKDDGKLGHPSDGK
jgi:hypothetical protein